MMRIPSARTIVRKIRRGPKLPIALTGAVALSIALTVVSVAWYSMGGSAKLDLSRPGYEQERNAVRTTDTQQTYDTTSPVTPKAVSDFLTEYDGRAKDLVSYGDFGEGALDDNDIQLTTQSGNSIDSTYTR